MGKAELRSKFLGDALGAVARDAPICKTGHGPKPWFFIF
jgi:hypothetical protein